MNRRFIIWASVLIVSLIIMGLAMRILAIKNTPFAEALLIRGITCLALVILFAKKKQLSLWPKSIKTQCVRALCAGLALTLFALSYNWLSASAVSVLSNIDVPLLILLGPIIGVSASERIRILAVLSILLLVWYVLQLEQQAGLFYGLLSLLTSCLLLCIGYHFIKKSMNEENQAITILTPSLAIIFYGLIEYILIHSTPFTWSFDLIIIDVFSGIGMFAAYFATMRLYNLTDLANAEFPTLLSSIIIQPIETLLLGAPLQMIYFLPSLAFVIMIYWILQMQKTIEDNTACQTI